MLIVATLPHSVLGKPPAPPAVLPDAALESFFSFSVRVSIFHFTHVHVRAPVKWVSHHRANQKSSPDMLRQGKDTSTKPWACHHACLSAFTQQQHDNM